MATTTYLRPQSGGPGLSEVATIDTSAGAGDAGKVPSLDANGKLALNMMPSGIGAATVTLTASEALAAGDFVNIHNNAGTTNVRKADNSNGRYAHGFVLSAVSSSAAATVFYGDLNTGLTGLTQGTVYYLGTSGAATATKPTTSGVTVQYLGTSTSTSAILTELGTPIILA